jgi:hypothetical protein
MDQDRSPREQKLSLDERIAAFDLSKLSLAGWLLSLSTLVIFAIAVSIVAVFGDTAGVNPNQNGKGTMKLIAYAMMFVAVAWFVVGKFLLQAAGISIIRGEPPRNRG